MSTNLLDIRESYGEKYGFKTTTKSAFELQKGLSEAVVKEISEIKNDPGWLRNFRFKAFAHFLQRPMPKWGADLSPINFDEITYYVRPTDQPQAKSWEELPPEIKNTFDKLGIPEAEKKFLAGVGAQFESENVYHSIQETLAQQGVIFVDPDTGLNPTEERIKQMGLDKAAIERANKKFREWFGRVVPIEDNKFAALNSAVFSGGSFIYIPPNVEVALPLQAYFRINKENVGQFERTLIIADKGSKVHYIEGCLPFWEEVSCGDTLRHITEIETGNNVLNSEGNETKVAKTMVRPFKGNIINITPISVGNKFSLTPEHPVLAIKRSIISRRKIKNGRRVRDYYAKKLIKTEPEFVEAGELVEGDFLVFPVNQTKSDSLMFTESLLKALGYYLAEGNISEINGCDAVVLNFNDLERDTIEDAKNAVLKVTGKKPSEFHDETKHELRLTVYSKEFYDLCETHCGKYAESKRLSKEIMDLPSEKQMVLFNSYFKGDGNLTERRPLTFRVMTASRQLAFQIQEILARAGIYASINIRKPYKEKMKDGRTINHQQLYIIYYAERKRANAVKKVGNYFLVPIRKIEKTFYNDLVYNFEVNKEPNTYLVKGFAVHNCTAPMYNDDKHSLHSAVVEIVALDGATVRYTTLQNWSNNVYNLVTKRAWAFEGATVEWLDANIGSRVTMKYPSVYMLGPHAKADILSVAYAGKGQHQDAGGKAVHIAPYTTSKIISKSVSKDGGRSTYRGLLHIAKGATNAKSTVRCVKPDTFILGDNRLITEYIAGDHTIGMSGLNTVAKKFINQFDGEMIKIEGTGMFPLEVTPEHPLLTSVSKITYPCIMRNGKHAHTARIILGKPFWGNADKLKEKISNVNGNYLLVPRIKGTIDTTGLDLTRFIANERGLKTFVSKKRSVIFPLNKETAWLLGLYIAEGYFSQSKIKFALNNNELKLIEKIITISKKLGYSAGVYRRSDENCAEVLIYADVLGRAFEEWCGKYAPNKQIPEFLLVHKDQEIVRSFLNGYLKGDGSLSKNCMGNRNVIHAVTTSKILAAQLQLIGARFGLFFRITKASQTSIIQGRKVDVHEKYDVRCNKSIKIRAKFDNDFMYVPIKKIEKVPYAGPVYNLETSDHSYIVSNAITHNCDALLLDEKSRTDTYPYNEIKEETATVTHEASVGKIGEDLVFYLMARGLTEQQALSMIVNGFLEVFTKELPMEYAVEFNRLIQLEMTGSVG